MFMNIKISLHTQIESLNLFGEKNQLIMLRKTAVMLVLLFPSFAFAQFYKVYPYATAEAGEKELVYWYSYISSEHTYSFFGKEVDRQGLMAHSLELEYGLSNKWTAGIYFDFEQPNGEEF